MFGIEPLARIVRHDARIEVKVPAAKGKKAYSYFREGGEGEKKSSGVGKKAALIGGGLALAGLGAAAIAMSRKKTEKGGSAAKTAVSVEGGASSKGMRGDKEKGRRTEKDEIKIVEIKDEPKEKKRIGSGAFGSVYLTEVGSAFKKANKGGLLTEDEVALTSEASKKGLAPKVLGVRRSEGVVVGYEMEFLGDYEPLSSRLAELREDRAEMGRSFDGALECAFKLHKEGIVHGDLHMFNIMQKDGETKIIDFGMSTRIDKVEAPSEIELSRWGQDLASLQSTYRDYLKKGDGFFPWQSYDTPAQKIFKKALDLNRENPREAYNYYKEAIKSYE